jgi:hypothetical protein
MDVVSQLQVYEKVLVDIASSTIANLHTQNNKPLAPDYDVQGFDTAPMEDRAKLLMSRVIEADALMASLPKDFASEEEQLEEMEQLEREDQELQVQLREALEKAQIYHSRVSAVLERACDQHLGVQKDTVADAYTDNPAS